MNQSQSSQQSQIQESVDQKDFQMFLKRQELQRQMQQQKAKEIQKSIKYQKPNKDKTRDSQYEAIYNDEKLREMVNEEIKINEQKQRELEEQLEQKRRMVIEEKKKIKRQEKQMKKEEEKKRKLILLRRGSQKKTTLLRRDSSSSIHDSNSSDQENQQNQQQKKQGKIIDLQQNQDQSIEDLSDDYHTSEVSDVNTDQISLSDSLNSQEHQDLEEKQIQEKIIKEQNLKDYKKYKYLQQQEKELQLQREREQMDPKELKRQQKRAKDLQNKMKDLHQVKYLKEKEEEEDEDDDDENQDDLLNLNYVKDAEELRKLMALKREIKEMKKVEQLVNQRKMFVQTLNKHEALELDIETQKEKIIKNNREIAERFLLYDNQKKLQQIIDRCFKYAAENETDVSLNQNQLQQAIEQFFFLLKLKKPVIKEYDEEEIPFIRQMSVYDFNENMDIYFSRFLNQEKVYFYELYEFFQKLLYIFSERYKRNQSKIQPKPRRVEYKSYQDQFNGPRYGPGY